MPTVAACRVFRSLYVLAVLAFDRPQAYLIAYGGVVVELGGDLLWPLAMRCGFCLICGDVGMEGMGTG